MIICILSLLATANDLLHCTHLCNFSSVWIVIWTLSVLAQPKDLLHWAHLWNFFAEWASLWIFRLPEWSNVFLHWSHLQSFSPLLWVVTKFIRALVSVFGHKSPELVSAILKSEPCAQSGHQVLRMWCQHLHSVLSVHFPFHSRDEENQWDNNKLDGDKNDDKNRWRWSYYRQSSRYLPAPATRRMPLVQPTTYLMMIMTIKREIKSSWWSWWSWSNWSYMSQNFPLNY